MPYRPYASDDYSLGISQEWRGRAIGRRYIGPNAAGFIGWLVFDVDRPEASTAWLDAGLPAPNLIVRNPKNGHAHLMYRLRGWVNLSGDNRPVRWLESIRRAYTVALDADPRYAGFLCKNPLHQDWQTTVGRDVPYDLAELSRYADFGTPISHLKSTDDEQSGRNAYVFDKLRHWAYRSVGRAKEAGRQDDWQDAVRDQARLLAIEARRRFAHADHAYPDAEAGHTAKSVADWTWNVYRGCDPNAVVRRREGQSSWARLQRRTLGCEERQSYLARLEKKRREAARRRALGEEVEKIAQDLSLSIRSVFRAIAQFGVIERAAVELVSNERATSILPAVAEKSDAVGAGGTFQAKASASVPSVFPKSKLMAYVSSAIERLAKRHPPLRE